MNVPKELKFTKDHEWVKVDGNIAVVGITEYAQSELGEIVFVDVQTEGEDLGKEESLGAIDAVKTVADIFMPVSGKIVEFNKELEGAPQLVNQDPYGKGWIVRVEMSDPSEVNELLDAEAYTALI